MPRGLAQARPDHKLRPANEGRHQLHITWSNSQNKEIPQYLFLRLDMLSNWGFG